MSGASIDQVAYKADRVRPGRTIALDAEAPQLAALGPA
jgi:hypothetical protein